MATQQFVALLKRVRIPLATPGFLLLLTNVFNSPILKLLLNYSTIMLQLTNRKLNYLVGISEILNDKTRIKILKLLFQNEEICVSDIAKDVKVSLSAVSHQLAKLEARGIVSSRRDGQAICYYLKKSKPTKLVKKFLELNF